MSAETIVNVAKVGWEVIKDGKSSVEIGDSRANAVPQVEDWQALTDTKGPMWISMPYSIGYIDVWPFNKYDHVQIKIVLKWDIGARYHGGGAYIPNIWTEVPECFVGYPWDANISFTAQNPTNAGSKSAPLARIPVTIKGTVKSFAEYYHVEWGFVLFGDGSWTRA